ncbi:MAG TPA: OmpH family outer membrane protein, partial [Acidobacteriota bacterium]|nr:OmpH family outer membrane protein [Acidobacteriota bacterium]
MKHWINMTIISLWLGGFAFAAQAPSAPEIGVRIAFVDTLAVLQQTEEGRQEISRIEQLVTQKQQDLQSQSTELQQLRERFLSQGHALNPETRAEMQRSIEEKERHVRR